MKRLFYLIVFTVLSFSVKAQQEPEFIGEVVAVNLSDNTSKLLPKEMLSEKINVSFSWFFTGSAFLTKQIELFYPNSVAQYDVTDKLQFIIRSVDNNLDPQAYVRIIRLVTKDDKRVSVSSITSGYVTEFSASYETQMVTSSFVDFTAKKYGLSSYLVEVSRPAVGEYAIAVANPHNINEHTIFLSSFGVQKGLKARAKFIANKHNPNYVADVLSRTIDFLLVNKMKPQRGSDPKYALPYVFDIFSEKYVDRYTFDDCFGAKFREDLITGYNIAKKNARKLKRKAKQQVKVRKITHSPCGRSSPRHRP